MLLLNKGRLALVVALALSAAGALATEVPDTLNRPATRVARPGQSFLLGVANAGDRVIAVGERGVVVLSDDQGKTWRQTAVPVSVTLTAVTFASAKKGWAVGHRGVILATVDGGETWTQQLEGRRFAQQALAQVKAAASPASAALSNAELLVKDGADKPFLDVSFTDEQHGLAVGAYGLCAATQDGGAHWASCIDQLPNPQGSHLYAIARSGGVTYIAGEQGLVLRAEDGANFSAVASPATTSVFSVGIAANGDVVLGSLRGAAFVSTDQGRSFDKLATDTPGSFSGATRTRDGRLLLSTQIGQLLQYDPAARRLKTLATPPMAPLTSLTQGSSGALVLVGVRGASVLPSAAP
jgi:photosystem II stability/assembly factor-like uncharacterized protein